MHNSLKIKCNGAPGGTRTHDILLRSRVTTLIKTCRSERKAEHNQQVVSNADQLLAPSLSPLSSRFITICHNYYYVFMTAPRIISEENFLKPAGQAKERAAEKEWRRVEASRPNETWQPDMINTYANPLVGWPTSDAETQDAYSVRALIGAESAARCCRRRG